SVFASALSVLQMNSISNIRARQRSLLPVGAAAALHTLRSPSLGLRGEVQLLLTDWPPQIGFDDDGDDLLPKHARALRGFLFRTNMKCSDFRILAMQCENVRCVE